MTDKQLHEKRVDILNKINLLLPFCKCNNHTNKERCKYCDELAVYGEQLLKLTKPRMNITTSGKIVPLQKQFGSYVRRDSVRIDIEKYIQAKLNKLSDGEFYEKHNVGRHSFELWKKENRAEIERLKKQMKYK